MKALQEIYPEASAFPDDARVVVSEPLSELPGVWEPVPEATALVGQAGDVEKRGFKPRAPAGFGGMSAAGLPRGHDT